MKNKTTVRLVISAVMLALAMVLSEIKFSGFWNMGGSVTLLSMLPVCILSIKYGIKWGVFTALLFSLGQLYMGIENLTYAQSAVAGAAIVALDYILPFTGLGLAGLFRKKSFAWLIGGISIVMVFRFICHFFSGVVIWGQWNVPGDWLYSLTYNGSYMLPELILTLFGAAALFTVPQIKKLISEN